VYLKVDVKCYSLSSAYTLCWWC